MVEILVKNICNQKELIFRMFMSCILGGIIGFERKQRHKGAGMRTHIIVCLGSALMMLVSKYGFFDLVNADGTRIASQVVSGIGFLGAGVIFVRNNAVNGLTTAAGLWVTAGIGLAIGAGQWVLSSVASLMVVLIQFLLHRIRIFSNESYRSNIRILYLEEKGVLINIEKAIQEDKISIVAIKIKKRNSGKTVIEVEAVFPGGYKKMQILNKLIEILGVMEVDI